MKTTSNVSIVLFFLAISLLTTDSCKEDSTLPFVKTTIATGITKTGATTGSKRHLPALSARSQLWAIGQVHKGC